MKSIALVLNAMFRMLGCLVWWWLGGIYSPQPPNGCWGLLLSMGAPDSLVRHWTCTVGCPMRRHITQPLGFGSSRLLAQLTSCGTRQSDATPDSYCSLSGAPLTLRALFFTVHLIFSFCNRPLCEVAVAPLVHRIVRWYTGQSGEL
jgi:hypothetical protein